jgi:trehalose synthase
VEQVAVAAEALDHFEGVIGTDRLSALRRTGEEASSRLTGRTVWNVNATAAGGGVAEMLQILVGYARGAGIDTRWIVLSASNPDFFRVTKRIHNLIHGSVGDGGELGEAERGVYEEVTAENAAELPELVRPGDIVLLHDPQTAGLVPAVRAIGAHPVWRCHIGPDVDNEQVRLANAFLQPYLEGAEGFVFSRQPHVPDWVPRERVSVIPPSIVPFSAENQDLSDGVVRAILASAGLVDDDPGDESPVYHRRDGSPARVDRDAELVRGRPLPSWESPLVLQVSRWDRLKDMIGVLRGFADHVGGDAHLMLVGPEVSGVSDDPEGAEVLDECAAAWDELDADLQARVHLVGLPMADREENAATVNALQRHATVVVQKSLAEGFGLTVTEAMWKARPMIASAIGGIQDQVAHGEQGLLLDDPTDLDAFGAAVSYLLANPDEADRLGQQARMRVTDEFVGARHLTQYAELFDRLELAEAHQSA